MTKITLTILAEDINNSKYLDDKKCAITQALHRAGFTNYHDVGQGIRDENREDVVTNENKTYQDLAIKVIGMYASKVDSKIPLNYERIPIEDFTHVLEF